jgi:hypothetical protein
VRSNICPAAGTGMKLSTNLSVFALGSPFGRWVNISWRLVVSVCVMDFCFQRAV